MPLDSLMEKLAQAGAVEKEGRTLSFTPGFAGHVIWTVGRSRLMDNTVGNWLEVLQSFHPSLGSLSADEVADVVLLFDFFLSHPEAPLVR